MDENRKTGMKKESRSGIIWGRVLGCVLIGYIAYGLWMYWFRPIFGDTEELNYWQYSECLINYQGGFVRRGLLGELVYLICGHTGMSPRYFIGFMCLFIYGSLFYFFFKRFRERHLCWWFLASPLMFGLADNIIRKDFLLFWFALISIMLLKNKRAGAFRCLAACSLIITGMFMHEAFIFFGVPVTALLLWNRNKRYCMIFVAISAAVFLLLCLNKGSEETGIAIVGSWNRIMEGDPLVYTRNNSIGSLGWDALDTFKFHLMLNTDWYDKGMGILMRPLAAFFAYYMVLNFLYTFRTNSTAMVVSDKRGITSVYVFLWICMIPMFTVLSCDYNRLYQYLTVLSVGSFLILDDVSQLFSERYGRVIDKINSWIDGILKPTKGWLMVVFILWAESCGFDTEQMLESSIYGKLPYMTGALIKFLYNL